MKILLLNPPNIFHVSSVLPDVVEEERGFNPPLGLMYIAGYIQKFAPEFEVKIIDCFAEQLDHEQISHKIKDFSPDVIGLTVMSFTLIDSMEIAKIAKSIDSNIKVVFGGPHVNIYERETIDLGNVDYIVLGEGEKNFYHLIKNINNHNNLRNIPGLVYYDQNKNYVHTGLPPLIDNLDKIPFPARNLINNNLYSSVLGTSKRVTTMITSRGCPYKCIFCDRPHLGKIFRARSAGNVVSEIKESMNYGIKEYLIYDDTFTIDRQRVIEICDLIVKEKLAISWDIRARVNTIDEEILSKLKSAGCVRIHYGVESGTQKILNVLRKGITIDQVKRAFELTNKAGIETLAYFMIGNPTETKEEIKKTIDFAKRLKPDYVHITATMPFPATDLYSWALDKKIIPKDVWLEYAKNPKQEFAPPLWIEHVSENDLHNFIKRAYRGFYFRPSYIVKRIFALKSFHELLIKAKAAKSFLKM
ncbi:MAG: radical SAM protein [Patescibacteria group bacterium]|nr:radical SAM protein [Patescibacteria group bacterium]